MEFILDTTWVTRNQRLDGLETKDETKSTTVRERMEDISTRPPKSIEQSSNEPTENEAAFTWPTQDINNWFGPPNDNGATKEVTINADITCGNGWVCEHRWRQIRNMVAFRSVVNGQSFSNWWDNGSNQVAFGRGNKGFNVFNNDDWALSTTLQTGLPAGTYCDVISGDKIDGNSTGIKVYVSGDGNAQFFISNTAGDPFIAIHVESKL
ncbi:alpha-amylase 1-like [Arvicola amphibius]|uniref:alpha-amylase 1-like n=1 Tax=Arvicola amphibius TaxID=1047088 RepID=UPI0018E3E284|nr:alpha-amylase 1-like [Arvicola amphibius]